MDQLRLCYLKKKRGNNSKKLTFTNIYMTGAAEMRKKMEHEDYLKK
jgi:hypothetical protein